MEQIKDIAAEHAEARKESPEKESNNFWVIIRWLLIYLLVLLAGWYIL